MEGAAGSARPDGIGGRTARHSFGLTTPECCHAARAAAIEKFAHCAVSVRFLHGDAALSASGPVDPVRTGRKSPHVTVPASTKRKERTE
ncbi:MULTISPECIES: hypothetical protein [unclassified Burkholderia]|uniref:hypothetical protein n=1 Tax=unclassified Burkholderia TaxID=2613784 RepID=UPI000A852625|nr:MULTISPECIES: hypothetical protein [unclassified Burkholderia]MBR8233412.1 hypothetical protein [Burkholderia sp. AU32357]MBY4875458.1 hypothetical protein [Burkholderia sp. AU42008]